MKLCAHCNMWIWDLIMSEVPEVTKDDIMGRWEILSQGRVQHVLLYWGDG